VLCSLTSSIGCGFGGHKTIRESPKEGYKDREGYRGPWVCSAGAEELRGDLTAGAAPHRERRGITKLCSV